MFPVNTNGENPFSSAPAKNAGALLLALLAFTAVLPAQEPAATASPALTCAAIEQFLSNAEMGKEHSIPKGVTAPKRATLTDGKITHDAAIQAVDESKDSFTTRLGTELNFKDSYKFDIAAYELAKMLELNMIPPYVPRRINGKPAAFSWWINDTMMESDRIKNKIEPPDANAWNKQMQAVIVFRQLVYDTDPNLTNLLITKDWRMWLIDLTRAFRTYKTVQNLKSLGMCDRKLLQNLRRINKADLRQKLGPWLTSGEIDGLAARASKIVEHYDSQISAKGEAAVLYDFPRTTEPCGAGL